MKYENMKRVPTYQLSRVSEIQYLTFLIFQAVEYCLPINHFLIKTMCNFTAMPRCSACLSMQHLLQGRATLCP